MEVILSGCRTEDFRPEGCISPDGWLVLYIPYRPESLTSWSTTSSKALMTFSFPLAEDRTSAPNCQGDGVVEEYMGGGQEWKEEWPALRKASQFLIAPTVGPRNGIFL